MKVEEKVTRFLKYPRPVFIKIAHLEIRTVIQISLLTRR